MLTPALKKAWLSSVLFMASPAMAEEARITDALHADLRTQACGSEYLILGDTDHLNDSIPQFVAERETLDIMKSCGIEKLFLEIEPRHQNALDALAQGTVTREAFIAQSDINIRWDADILADLVINAGNAGMEVIASDLYSQTVDTESHGFLIEMGFLAYADIARDSGHTELSERVRSYTQTRIPMSAEDRQMLGQVLYDNQNHPAFAEAQEYFAEANRMQEASARRTNDRMLVDVIHGQKEPGERVGILIGNAHPSDRETGLDVLLGPQNTVWVALSDGHADVSEAVPDRIYNLDTRKVIIPSPAP